MLKKVREKTPGFTPLAEPAPEYYWGLVQEPFNISGREINHLGRGHKTKETKEALFR